MNSTTINDLHLELWQIIFGKLSIRDLLKCRLVNKKFKNFSEDSDGIYKLAIGEIKTYDHIYWSYNNKLVDKDDIISLKFYQNLKTLSLFNLDKYLKYLKIYDSKFMFKEMSNLSNKLEIIEISFRDQSLVNYYQFHLDLRHLKYLKCFLIQSGQLDLCRFNLSPNKLKKIEFYNIKNIEFNLNLDSIEHLITNEFDNNLKIFRNLKIIEFRYIEKLIDENLFFIFKKLKQLKINCNQNYLKSKLLKNNLIEILNNRIESKRQIDIYLEGVKILNMIKVNELMNARTYWEFIFNNYDQLDLNIPFIHSAQYEEFEYVLDNIRNIPSNFFDKFFNITRLELFNVFDVDGLKWFMNNLKNLKTLRIYLDECIDQINNNLPTTIEILYIYNAGKNCESILKLPKLRHFSTKMQNYELDKLDREIREKKTELDYKIKRQKLNLD